MTEKEINELIALFDELEEETFYKKCYSIRDNCKGCQRMTCLKNGRVSFWINQYKKTILKRLSNGDFRKEG